MKLPLALLCCVLAAASATQAEQSDVDTQRKASGRKPSSLVRLAPTAADVTEARRVALERRIAQTITALSGVSRVHVQLTLPELSEQPLDAQLPRARAALVLTHEGPPPRDDELARIVHSAVGADVELAIVRRPVAPAAPALVRIGPFRVERESASAVRATLVVMLVTNALLAALVLRQATRDWRDRPREPKVDRRGRTRARP